MSAVEPWFIFAVASALVGGFGAFANKVSAQKKYDSDLVVIINALTGVLIYAPAAFFIEGIDVLGNELIIVMLASGVIATIPTILKINALLHIDSAIFLPLFKVIGPIIVVAFGIAIFGEAFSTIEWIGIILSLMVPILLISRVENSRQNNLKLGLILLVVAASVSAVVAVIQKYATGLVFAPIWIVALSSTGILVGATLLYAFKHGVRARQRLVATYSRGVFYVGLTRTIFSGGGFLLTIYAYSLGGPLGIVYTINSLYILPPIILAIIFYKEHWNARKIVAITLSIVALALLQ